MKKIYTFTILLVTAEEGGFVVTCPGLPGVTTEGNTLEEATTMAKDAVRLVLESRLINAEPIPPNPSAFNIPHEVTVIMRDITVTATVDEWTCHQCGSTNKLGDQVCTNCQEPRSSYYDDILRGASLFSPGRFDPSLEIP
ncbi:TPA: hypothetical protein DEB72_03760 [Patescibacteria group bacterium]|nr:hypothetical protein [Patescibacteria group bacterium]